MKRDVCSVPYIIYSTLSQMIPPRLLLSSINLELEIGDLLFALSRSGQDSKSIYNHRRRRRRDTFGSRHGNYV